MAENEQEQANGEGRTALAPMVPQAIKDAPVVRAAKAMRDMITAIRGTQWGQECSPEAANAVARWALRYNVDAARHVEMLGGRIYLNGEFYEEKAAPLVMAGKFTVSEPQFVHHDERLQKLADGKDAEMAEWARGEIAKRMMARITLGIPDDATGACVYRIRVTGTETVIVGFNWCGGSTKLKKRRDGSTYRGDPVGDADPTKTAQSRAKRRAWRQVLEAFPDELPAVQQLERSSLEVSAELDKSAQQQAELARSMKPKAILANHAATDADPYASDKPAQEKPIEVAVHAEPGEDPTDVPDAVLCRKHRILYERDLGCRQCMLDEDAELARE